MPKMLKPRALPRRSLSIVAAAATTAFVLASGLVFGPRLGPSSAAPIGGSASVSGTIYRDFNINNVRDVADRNTDGTVGAAEWTEPGQAGITVRATCMTDTGPDNATGTAANTVDDVYGAPISVTSAANGSYALAALPAGKCRIDIVPPATMSYMFDTKMGGSLVRFVDLSGGNSTQDVGLIDPSQYTGPTSLPQMVNGANWGGSATAAGTPDSRTTESLLISNAFTRGTRTQGTNAFTAGDPYTGAGPTELTTWSQHGSIWGLAVQRTSGKIFAGAFLRRLAGLGTGGIDAIYAIGSTGGATSTFTTAVDAGSVDPEGSCSDATCRDFLDAEIRNRDIDAFAQVGKTGWGDLDMSADDRTLFAVNLFDRNLYKFPLNIDGTANGVAAAEAIPNPVCTAGTNRPWGLAVHDGLVYAGVVCDGSTGTRADLGAFVYAYNPGTAAVALPDGSATVATDSWSGNLVADANALPGIQLDYSRACSRVTSGTCDLAPWARQWNTWSDDPALYTQSPTNHQPILSDIEFADDGGLLLSFADRWAWQGSGAQHFTPVNGSTTMVENSQVAGDLLRTAYMTSGLFAAENAGTVAQSPALGGGTLSGWSTTVGQSGGATAGTVVGGPGSGEFFNDNAVDSDPTWVHAESHEGGIAKIPGNPELPIKLLDADDPLFTHGIAYVFETNGLRRGNGPAGVFSASCGFQPWKQCGYQEFGISFSLDPNGFGKAGALTDLELLAAAAPVEVGNRVWYDANANGIQDGGELPISGVVVTLTVTGFAARTAVTDSNGNYRFSSAVGTNDAANIYGVTELASGATYTVSAPTTVSFGGGTRNITSKTVGTETGSDANTGTGVSDALTINGPGQNAHAVDFGYSPAVTKYSLGNYVFVDDGSGAGVKNNRIKDGTEAGKAGVSVSLFASDGSGNPTGAALATVTTDASGFYKFNALDAGDYVVRVNGSNFSGVGVLMNWLSSTGNESAFAIGQDNRDHGIDNADPATNGILSPKVTLGVGMPTTENEPGSYGSGSESGVAGGADENNLTVDFSFVPMIDLQVTKAVTSAGPYSSGATVSYTLTARNNGPGTASAGYTVTDVSPSGVTITAISGTGFTCVLATQVCTATGTLASATNASVITVTGTVNTGVAASTVLKNVAYVSPASGEVTETNVLVVPTLSTDTVASTTNNDAQASVTTPGPTMDLSITKTVAGSDPRRPGDTLTYILTVTNNGPNSAATGFTVNDLVPSGLTATAITGTGWTCTLGTVSCSSNAGLAASISAAAITVTATVNAGVTLGSTLKNVVYVSPASGETTPETNVLVVPTLATDTTTSTTNNDAQASVTIVPAVDLELTKVVTSAGPYIPGATVTYTLTARNNGPGTAITGYTVTDIAPSGVTITAISGTGFTCVLATLVCTSTGSLASATNAAVITVTGTVNTGLAASTVLKNVAYVSPASGEVTETNVLVVPTVSTDTATSTTNNDAQASVTTPGPTMDLSVTKSVAGVDPRRPGDSLTYTLTARNNGPNSAAAGFTVTDLVPSGLTATAISGTGWTCTLGTVSCSSNAGLAALTDASPITVTVTVNAGVTLGSTLKNVVYVSPASGETTPETNVLSVPTLATDTTTSTTNNDAQASVTIVPAVDLQLTKVVTSAGPYIPGATVTYTLTARNNGPGTAITGYTVTDIAPSGVTISAISGTGFSCVLGTLVCTSTGTLASATNASVITVTGTVNSGLAPSTIKNVAYISPASGEVTETNVLVVPTVATDTAASTTNNDSEASITTPGFSLGNYVWIDNGAGGGTANDGSRNGGELAKAAVIVKLYAADGSGNPTGAALHTVTTDSNGRYRFDGLAPLTYVVVIDPVNFQAGGSLQYWVSSTGNQSTFATSTDFQDHGIDSGTAATNGVRSPAVALGAGVSGEDQPATYGGGSTAGGTAAADGQDNLNVDFGFWAPVPALSITKTVRKAGSSDAFADTVTVPAGTLVEWQIVVSNVGSAGLTGITVTDAVASGCAHVSFDLAVGVSLPAYTCTTTATANVTNTAIATATGTTGGAVPGPVQDSAQANVTYSLGNRVWLDINHDGDIDSGEPGIDGVVLELLDGTLTPTGATATTAGGGYYRFDGLAAGSYAVRVAGVNFTSGALVNRISTDPDAASANNDIDSNDDGAGTAASAQSDVVVLGPTEPTTDIDQTTGDAARPDVSTNLSVDFGFVGNVDVGITIAVSTPTPTTGQEITYTLTITNHSVTNVSNVTVDDLLPPGVRGVSATGDGWVLDVTPEQLTGSYAGVLAPGESKTIVLHVVVVASVGSITNTATVGVAGDTVASNNVDNVPVTLRSAALPRTGADILRILIGGALVLLIGIGLALAASARRRSRLVSSNHRAS